IRMSETTRSGSASEVPRRWSASLPSDAACTSSPSAVRMRDSRSRLERSSSTTRTRYLSIVSNVLEILRGGLSRGARYRGGDEEGEGGPGARHRVHLD